MTACEKCGMEVLWVTCGIRRIPLDVRERVYRILTTGGTPTVEQVNPILGFPNASGVDHRTVCPHRFIGKGEPRG